VRETGQSHGRGDPFRPALQVLDGGVDTKPARRPSRVGDGADGARTPKKAKPPVKPKRLPRLADQRRRLRLAALAVLLLFTAIAGRLVQLQLTDAKTYAARGLQDRLHTVPLAAPRGAITDRDGFVLAQSVDARFVYADPDWVTDPAHTADVLSPLLGVPRSELLRKVSRHTFADGRAVRFEFLARGVDVAVGERVKALNLAGIGVRQDERREVPGHDLAANLIGFTGSDLTGLGGIEANYNGLLRSVDGSRTYEIGNGKLDVEIPGGYHVEKPAKPGTSVQLTIDRDLQYEVQHILSDRMRAANATFGSAVVLDVHTGEVLGQASYPGYDAAEPFNSPPDLRGDASTGVAVDPGSVAKVIALSAALQEGKVTPDSTVEVAPKIIKGDKEFLDHHPFKAGTQITLPALLAFSSNVGAIQVASRLTPQQLYAYQQAYGLGKPTGEGLPGESGGLLQPPSRWSGSSYGSIPIGDSISVTPLQMAAVYATIANNGLWVQPHLVRATKGADGRVVPAGAPATRRVISPENATALRTMLEAVVTVPGATGLAAAVPGYRVAGKTGTGLKVADGKYLPGDVSSFVGMAPADNPQYVIAVFAYNPQGTGGTVAAPVFRDMMTFTLGHYSVPPTGTRPPTFTLTR
jgi:cell division protein FtsI (penicillin-binding protein 3)